MKVKQNDEEYNKYVEAVTPKHNCFKNCLNAFWIGGLICLLGQAINNFMSSYFEFNKEDAGSYTSLIRTSISDV